MAYWDRLTRTVAPTDSIIAVEDAQTHLRVDGEDSYVQSLIDAATAFIEGPNGIGVALLTQQWRLSLDHLTPLMTIPLGPVSAVAGVTYTDMAGNTQTLDPALYRVDLDCQPARIIKKPFVVYPPDLATAGAVKINFTAGYGIDPSTVPADLRHAALMIVSHLYENREATTSGQMSELPLGACSILDRYRVPGIA